MGRSEVYDPTRSLTVEKDKYIFVLMQNLSDCFMLLFGYFIDDDFDDIIFFGRAEGAVEAECFLLMGLADEIEVGMLGAEGDDEFHFVVEKMEEFVFYCSSWFFRRYMYSSLRMRT